jgi:hypothetical protein
MLDIAARPDIVGIGAYEGIHGLFSRGTDMVLNHQEEGIWLHSGSLGYHVWALNVANAVKVGGFDPELRYAEDVELARMAYIGLGVPWYIYTGATTSSMLKHNPGPEFGGVSQSARNHGQIAMHARVYNAHPEYISPTDKKYRCYWRKLAADKLGINGQWPLENIRTYKPFDWRK